jgi:hypothetical protein
MLTASKCFPLSPQADISMRARAYHPRPNCCGPVTCQFARCQGELPDDDRYAPATSLSRRARCRRSWAVELLDAAGTADFAALARMPRAARVAAGGDADIAAAKAIDAAVARVFAGDETN